VIVGYKTATEQASSKQGDIEKDDVDRHLRKLFEDQAGGGRGGDARSATGAPNLFFVNLV
jgi:hypothetical protein